MNKPLPISHQQQLSSFTKSLIDSGKEVWLEANGLSMYPHIKPGDKVKVIPFEINHVNPGDLIVFQRKNYFVLHRVCEKVFSNGTASLKTMGDSDFHYDELVNHTNYLGKIIRIKHKGMEQEVKKKNKPIRKPKRIFNWLRKKIKARWNWF